MIADRRIGFAGLLLVLCGLATALIGIGPAYAQPAPGTYCDPAATLFDPGDVPEGGSVIATPPGVRERRIAVSGVSTSVLEAGRRRSREAVVLLHGNPGSSQDWADLLPRLGRKGRRAVAFDLVGFGHADKPWDYPYDVATGAEFIDSALKALRVRRAHLVVHDLGGVVGMEWASLNPTRVRSVVVIDSGVLLGYRHHEYAQVWRSPGLGEASMAAVNRDSFDALLQYGQRRPLPAPFVDRTYDDFDRRTRCAILETYRAVDEDEIAAFSRRQADALAPYDLPARVIWGRHDPYLPVAMAERQREAFPSAKVAVFEEAAHWPFVDEPARTRAIVVPFIRRHFGKR